MTVMPVQNCPSTFRNWRASIAGWSSVVISSVMANVSVALSLTAYRIPTVKSWPHRLTAVDSRAIHEVSSTSKPSQPNSISNPPGVFM